MTTALTIFGTNVQSSVLATAAKLDTASGGATGGSNTQIGTATGYSEIFSLATANAWQSLGALPSQAGQHGWLLEGASLEGVDFVSANWTPTVRLQVQSGNGNITGDLVIVLYTYNTTYGGSVYPTFHRWGTLTTSGITITSSSTNFGVAATPSSAPQYRNSGDMLYYEIWFNCTSQTNTLSTAQIRAVLATGATGSTNVQIVTSGYNPATSHPTTTTLLAMATAGTLNVQNAPLPLIKQQIVKVYSASRVFIDVWRDCPLLGSPGCTAPKFAVNTATSQVTVTLPRTFDKFDEAGDGIGRGTVTAGNIVQFWIYDNGPLIRGRLVYEGYIDAYKPRMADDGSEVVEVTLTPWDAVVGDVTYIGTHDFGTAGSSGTYIDTVTMFNYPFSTNDPITTRPYTYPLTLNSANPATSGTLRQLRFHNQNLATWFEMVRNVSPAGWFWRADPDRTVTFKQTPGTATHTFTIGKDIAHPEYQKDYQPLKNDIYIQGTGVTGRSTGVDLTTYGRRARVVVEDRIIDANTAQAFADALLASLDKVQIRTPITVVDYRGDEAISIGYDIETINVGDSCRIQHPTRILGQTLWDGGIWDVSLFDYPSGTLLTTTVAIASLTYYFDHVDLELALIQPSADKIVIDLAQQFGDSQFN